MKRIPILICLIFASVLFYSHATVAQTKAVTTEGEEVLLFKDGTWKYAKAQDATAKEIAVNPTVFVKPADATFQLKSNIIKTGFYLNPKKWSFKKSDEGESSEYELEMKGKDAYGMVIAERIEIPIESLKKIAFENAMAAAPDIELVKEEFRNVNGTKVLCMQMKGTIQGIKFTYFGYYFSNESGSIQFLTYTAQSLFKEYQPEMENLLNGFVLLD